MGRLTASVLLLWAGTLPGFSTVLLPCHHPLPEIRLTYPSEGVAIQTQCFKEFNNTCFTDTVYADTLLHELAALYRNSQHVAVALVDSARPYLIYDSTYMGGALSVDTLRSENVGLTFQVEVKGILSQKHAAWKEAFREPSWVFDIPTFAALIDTPFLAFFNSFENSDSLGIAPYRYCNREPSAYFLIQDRIFKRGTQSNARGGGPLPGVSVSMEEFLRAVGHGGLGTLPRARSPEIRIQVDGKKLILSPLGFHGFPETYRVSLHDVRGKALVRFGWHGRESTTMDLGAHPQGAYFLDFQNGNARKTYRLTLSHRSNPIVWVPYPAGRPSSGEPAAPRNP